jgi:glycogen debranching enzyme
VRQEAVVGGDGIVLEHTLFTQTAEEAAMTQQLVVLDGSTFFVSDLAGDTHGEGTEGFFHADVRHLSQWGLLVDGAPIRVLTSRTPDYYSARVFGIPTIPAGGANPRITIRRDRFVADGVHEDLLIDNNSDEQQRVRVEFRYASDFADIFEVKEGRRKSGRSWVETGSDEATIWYEHDGFRRGTRLAFGAPSAVGDEATMVNVAVEPRGRWRMCIDISCLVDGEEVRPRHDCRVVGRLQPNMPLTFEEWIKDAPRLETPSDALAHAYRQSLGDLAALRCRPRKDLTWSLPAAGLPWFMALFGRDSLLTAYQVLPFQARLAHTTLKALAALQSKDREDFRDAEPGKVLHELRRGKLASLGEVSYTPYYGTHDATPLFLILLDEYERWSGDVDLVRALEPAARAALAWIEAYGDPDGDGYLEYRRRSPRGLDNQGWKDSWNSILFADGRLADPPIATCELQGYAHDARRRAARLAREVWGDEDLAVKLEADATLLKERFNRDFWNHERGHYVLALDAEKRQVDSLTSNVGHLLWSGIVDEERAETVVGRLMASDMFSGWGIRTMSSNDAGYNPVEYHNGTVWPHDTAFVAEGMRRYGFREEASALAAALIEAAEDFDYRLPEVFAGFPRKETETPVEYPTASRPQAWAAGATLLALRTILGLDVVSGGCKAAPHLPEAIGPTRLLGVRCRGERVDVPS